MSAKTINLELHCHTVYSKDGLISLESLARVAEQLHLDAIAVTDHDTVEGAREFQRWLRARGAPLQAIVGEERTLRDGSHLIGLFLEEPILALELEEALAEITGQGGLALVPHPFRRKDGLLREDPGRLTLLEARGAAFELYNAKGSAVDNARARALLTSGLAPFVGSDAHYESDLGQSLNVVAWQGDLHQTVADLVGGRAACRLLARPQRDGEAERRYAPMYYRVKRYLALPNACLPAAKGLYRWYRNRRYGVGPKPLQEVYAR